MPRRNFYRATRMHSADHTVARCLFVRLSFRLSVCPSHAGIVCKRLHISTKFLPSRSPTVLVFPHQTGCQNSDGDPTNGGAECKGGMNK